MDSTVIAITIPPGRYDASTRPMAAYSGFAPADAMVIAVAAV